MSRTHEAPVDHLDNDTIERRPVTTGRTHVTTHEHDHDRDTVELKNRVQFGPIVAGVLSAIAIMLILTILGLAIGASALEPREANQALGFGAAAWGIISALIAFFVGGWVAAKTAAVAGTGSGLINGLMVGAAVIALALWLTGSGVGALLGTLGTNIADITSAAQSQGVTSTDVESQVSQIDSSEAFDTVRDSAWSILAGLVIPLVAAGLGGLVGHNERRDVIQPGR